MNTWKEYPHVMTMFSRGMYDVPQKTFLQKFLEGASVGGCVYWLAHAS